MNQGAHQETLLKQIKGAVKWYSITFNSLSVSTEENVTNILDHKWDKLVTSDQ